MGVQQHKKRPWSRTRTRSLHQDRRKWTSHNIPFHVFICSNFSRAGSTWEGEQNLVWIEFCWNTCSSPRDLSSELVTRQLIISTLNQNSITGNRETAHTSLLHVASQGLRVLGALAPGPQWPMNLLCKQVLRAAAPRAHILKTNQHCVPSPP